MKILFAHDHKFYVDSAGKYYSPGNFHYTIWQRYLSVFKEIVVVARSQPIISNENLKESSGPNVSFVIVPNISSIAGRFFHYSKVRNFLTQNITQVDGVIARLPSVVGSLAIKVAEALHKPWAVEVVGCAWDSYWTHGSPLAKVFALYAYYSTRKLVRKSKFTLYVTETFLQTRYPSYGVQTHCSNVEIEPVNESVLAKRMSFLESNRDIFKIGFIGSLATKTKGLETALKALGMLHEKMDFVFEIVGNGPKDEWMALVERLNLQQNVRFLGTLSPGDEISSWLDRCHLYIQPSYTEGLPRAVIEAMSRGCSVVASDVGGIPELLSPDVLVSPKDHKKLAEKIYFLYSNKQTLLEQAKNNFYTAKKYEKPILDARRQRFWKKFADYIESYPSV